MRRFLSLSSAAILLIASGSPMLAAGGTGSGSGSGSGQTTQSKSTTSSTGTTSGRTTQSKSTTSSTQKTRHGMSSQTPGHKMQKKYSPRQRGMAKGASQYAPGNPR
jgi:hypothetical protein